MKTFSRAREDFFARLDIRQDSLAELEFKLLEASKSRECIFFPGVGQMCGLLSLESYG